MTTNISVLVVDDDDQIREISSRRLSGAGYIPVCSSSGEEALTLLSRHHFDLVLLDIMMQSMSGIEVLREIQSNYPDLAVIMITSENDPQVAKSAIELGALGYMVKPFSENEFLIYVSHMLRLQQLTKENREHQKNLEEQVTIRTMELKKALTDLKASQEQLLQQEKLATIGHLAAGVAHEIKNPTGYISSNLRSMNKYLNKISEFIAVHDKALQDLSPENITELRQAKKHFKLDFLIDDSRCIIAESLEGTDKINKIVEGLKSFSRKEQNTARSVNINECLETALTVAWNELKYKTSIEKKFGILPLVECFPNQLGQVFMNLLVNASHAIEKQGTITITTQHADDTVIVSIADTGCGIPQSIQKKIFEPFFTTKKDGVGTGLGLSIIKEIVAKHNGKITVESEVGKGSVFTITLPRKQPQCPVEEQNNC